MNILVGCEESQRVTTEFRKMGFNAFSCDILPTSGDHKEWHIMEDVLHIINGNCVFKTCDGVEHRIEDKWDLIIAFPPCTHLAVSGAKHFEKKRIDGRQRQAIEFFSKFLTADCERIAIENPIGIISGNYIKDYYPELCEIYSLPIKPSQKIQPYFFGEHARKTTCLWLKGLPLLSPTEIVEPRLITYKSKNGKRSTFSVDYCRGGGNVAQRRSKTYKGIAKAMATQWGNYLRKEKERRKKNGRI